MRVRKGFNAGVRGVVVALIQTYRWTLKPLLPPACRFVPTCSEYALTAVRRHGPWKGSWLALRRLARCHPWHPGGYDPVPDPADPRS